MVGSLNLTTAHLLIPGPGCSDPNRAPAPTVPPAALLPGSCSLHPQLSPTNSHTCSPKGPATPTAAEATCSGPFRDPCHGAGLGCSCTLFSTFLFAAAAISADSCTGTGAACSCRRSRHLRLRRGGPSKAYNVQAAGKTWAVCFGLPMTLFDPRTIDWEKLKQKRLCKSFSL